MVCVCIRTLNHNYRAIHMDGPLIPLARKTVAKNQLTACSLHIALLFSLKVSRNCFCVTFIGYIERTCNIKERLLIKGLRSINNFGFGCTLCVFIY